MYLIMYRNFYILIFMLILSSDASGAFESLIEPEIPGIGITHISGENGYIGCSGTARFGLPELGIKRLDLLFESDGLKWEISVRSTGDDIYREHFLSGSCGLKKGNISSYITADFYYVYIKNYDSVIAPGLSIKIIYAPNPNLILSGGVNGLIPGRLRDNYSDISRIGWGAVSWSARERTTLTGGISISEHDRSSLSIAVEERITDHLGLSLLLRDHPKITGGGIRIYIDSFVFNIAFTHQTPLGWSQQFGVGWTW